MIRESYIQTYIVQYQTLYIVHWILGRSYENSISTKTSSLPDLSQNYIPVQDESYSQNVSFYSMYVIQPISNEF